MFDGTYEVNVMNLKSNEVLLTGKFVALNGQVKADETALRIKHLTTNVLLKVATSDDGWASLYKDPNDNRLWELTYLNSGMHGGGEPLLAIVSLEQAMSKYRGFVAKQ